MQLQTLATTIAILIQGVAMAGLLIGVAAEAHDVSGEADTPWSTIGHPEESPGAEASFYPIVRENQLAAVDFGRFSLSG
ncbi:hypothetical protein FGU65_14450 [Methanoculleus sp. FWC-SCC1]|uniref:Uncharacterized protein n=1 Tax=Methanoculleus frigidifontis TaxID=2584085 RepID=A0ABT8MDR7_9EURY|nr:hypothetical protein [Methanoculleus sp. FWC-SCC1]MDN7026066.1 hypothetical protein [Methanoculleus sp. FWC-SCC1]